MKGAMVHFCRQMMIAVFHLVTAFGNSEQHLMNDVFTSFQHMARLFTELYELFLLNHHLLRNKQV